MFDNYTVLDALAFAIEIHEQQGFVKSGHGTVRIADDGETEIRIFDNKTCILEKIKLFYKLLKTQETFLAFFLDTKTFWCYIKCIS